MSNIDKKIQKRVKKQEAKALKIQRKLSSFSFVRYKNSQYVPLSKLNPIEMIMNTFKYVVDKKFKEKSDLAKREMLNSKKHDKLVALTEFMKKSLIYDNTDFKSKIIQIDNNFSDVIHEVLSDRVNFSDFEFRVLDINENYKKYVKNIPILVKCTYIEEVNKYEEEKSVDIETYIKLMLCK